MLCKWNVFYAVKFYSYATSYMCCYTQIYLVLTIRGFHVELQNLVAKEVIKLHVFKVEGLKRSFLNRLLRIQNFYNLQLCGTRRSNREIPLLSTMVFVCRFGHSSQSVCKHVRPRFKPTRGRIILKV